MEDLVSKSVKSQMGFGKIWKIQLIKKQNTSFVQKEIL